MSPQSLSRALLSFGDGGHDGDGEDVGDGGHGDGVGHCDDVGDDRYNMEEDGERISESLHGACPTALGIK